MVIGMNLKVTNLSKPEDFPIHPQQYFSRNILIMGCCMSYEDSDDYVAIGHR